MKRGLIIATICAALFSPSAHTAEIKITLRDLLSKKYPELQTALRHDIDAASGVQGAGRGAFPYAETDLNGDGVPELLIAYDNSYFGGSAGNYPVEIFTPQSTGGWRWLGQVWGGENRPLIIGKRAQGWATIRFEKHLYCWKDLQEGEPPPEKGYAGHLPQGGMYVYCDKQQR